ncbi:TetR family transcriptional regulator [Leifsonia shinshuensis]|uniref:AcrR family transcriptional regulator n=1 Tax=Leifsonia shinshuensis TaxID=150026 RepID=A0A853CSZ4_9MICO|nr:AcrR family transcriptional regulator [Leifsonia shinshuensis]
MGGPEQPARRRGPYAKSTERRQQIVDEAYRVFATRGYHGSSLREIAAAAGIGLSTLQHHFGGKEDLLLAVLARRDEWGGRVQPPGDEAAGDEASGDMASGDEAGADLPFPDTVIAQARRNEGIPGLIALYSILAAEATAPDHPGHEYFLSRYARMQESYEREFAALAADGRLRDGVDPALAAATVVALWEGIQLQWLYAPERVDAAAALRGYLDLVILPEQPAPR